MWRGFYCGATRTLFVTPLEGEVAGRSAQREGGRVGVKAREARCESCAAHPTPPAEARSAKAGGWG
jgi:hypothetical protein